MSTTELAPRHPVGGIVAVWVVAVVVGVVVGVFAGDDWRAPWLTVGMGACLVLAFGIQLAYGRSQGFTQRLAASALGALFVLGIISLGFGLAGIVPG